MIPIEPVDLAGVLRDLSARRVDPAYRRPGDLAEPESAIRAGHDPPGGHPGIGVLGDLIGRRVDPSDLICARLGEPAAPSGPVVIWTGPLSGVGIGYSVIWPVLGSSRPICPAPYSVNQTAPSGPSAMPAG